MPQTLSEEWKKMLGKDWKGVFEDYLHSIGNLTLTGYNPELSNKSFEQKKKDFSESNIQLNKYFDDINAWTEVTIIDRAKKLSHNIVEMMPRQMSTLEFSTSETEEIERVPIETILAKSLKAPFKKTGDPTIFRHEKRTLLVRASQFYNRSWANYWYGTTPKDLDRVEKYSVNDFAFVCANKGVVLISSEEMLQKIKNDELWLTKKDNSIRHYHIHFSENGDSILWLTKKGGFTVSFYPISE